MKIKQTIWAGTIDGKILQYDYESNTLVEPRNNIQEAKYGSDVVGFLDGILQLLLFLYFIITISLHSFHNLQFLAEAYLYLFAPKDLVFFLLFTQLLRFHFLSVLFILNLIYDFMIFFNVYHRTLNFISNHPKSTFLVFFLYLFKCIKHLINRLYLFFFNVFIYTNHQLLFFLHFCKLQ